MNWDRVLKDLRECAETWSPDARVVGNVRCGDIVEAVDAAFQAIAEHPADDDELHTEEWLRSVGFDTDWFPDHGRPLCIKFGLCGKLSIWSNGVTMISIRGCYERIGEHHTRGDVRRLCAALGVPLKEGE